MRCVLDKNTILFERVMVMRSFSGVAGLKDPFHVAITLLEVALVQTMNILIPAMLLQFAANFASSLRSNAKEAAAKNENIDRFLEQYPHLA